MDAGKQAKINQITEAYEKEMERTKKTLKRAKLIKEELIELTEKYQKNIIERSDELEEIGVL
jgi:phage-related tail protein